MLRKLLLVAGLLSSAAAHADDTERDPWAAYNRPVFNFNMRLDRYVMKPVATTYVDVMPGFAVTGIHNFFNNLGDVLVVLHDGLQGKGGQFGDDLLRLIVNTSFGVAGFIDVGSRVGLPKHQQDLGITLGVWGVPSGPYVVLPFWGPSTLRDAPSGVFDLVLYPTYVIQPLSAQLAADGLYYVDERAALLPLQGSLDSNGDPYSLVREIYLQRRDVLIHGVPKSDPFTDDGGN